MRPDKERPAENTCRIVKGLDAVWAHFCPSKPCLPLSSDGREYAGKGKLESAFKTGGRPSFCPVQRQVCPLHGDDQNGDQNDLGDYARKGIGHCAGKEKGEIEHRVLQSGHHKPDGAPHQTAGNHGGDQRGIHRPAPAGENMI